MITLANENILDDTAFKVLNCLLIALRGHHAGGYDSAAKRCDGRPARQNDKTEKNDSVAREGEKTRVIAHHPRVR